MLSLEIMKWHVLMAAECVSYLGYFLYLFEAEFYLIGKFFLDLWWFELTLEIYVKCMDVFARVQVANTGVLEQKMERATRVTQDELQVLNLNTQEEPQGVKVSANLDEDLKHKLRELLLEFKNLFAWKYTDRKRVKFKCSQKLK